MKILIIGGTRFLGHHITKRLLADGHAVTLFNRGRTPDDFGDKVRRIHGDRYDAEAFSNAFKGEKFDIVIDMIAYRPEDSQTAILTFLGNVGHFFHISSAAVYTLTNDYTCPLREEDFDRELYPKPRTDDKWWFYGYNKRKCEEVLQEAFQKHRFPVTMFRPPIIIGERDYTLRAYSYFIRITDGKPLILPDGGMNIATHVYQEDIVRALSSNLMNSTSYGKAYNLAQEEYLSLRDFVLKAAEVIDRKIEIVDIPSKILKETSFGLFFSPFSNRRPFILDIQKAKEELQFSSTPFMAWLRKTIYWFLEKYEGEPPENYKLREREIGFIQRYKKAFESIT